MASADQVLSTLQRARTGLPDGSVGAQNLDGQIAGRQSAMSIGQSVRSIPGAVSAAVAVPFSKPKSQAQSVLSAMPDVPAQNPTDMRLASGVQRSPMAAPGARPAAVSAPQALSSVGAMAKPAAPAFDFDTFQPQSGEGAFRNEQTGRVTRLQSEPTGARQQLATPPRGLASYASEPQRQDVRAPVLNPNGGVFSSMVDFTNQAGQAMQAIAANKGMRNDRKDALDQQRVGLDAASTLAKIDQGYQSLGLDGRRADTADRLAGVQEGELGLKRETQGIANRLATQQEQLRSQIATEQDPAKRKSLVQRLMDFEGKTQQADPYLVVPGGQQIDPVSQLAYNTPSSVFNRQTGQWIQQPQGQVVGAPSENHVAWLKQNPGQAANFDQIYGVGAAKRALGG